MLKYDFYVSFCFHNYIIIVLNSSAPFKYAIISFFTDVFSKHCVVDTKRKNEIKLF